ncbi:hypothetical protein ACFL2T_02730 [Elusimicrobiota bacterium]
MRRKTAVLLAALLPLGGAPAAMARGPVPDVVIVLRQRLFQTTAFSEATDENLPKNIEELSLRFRSDGIHATGRYDLPIVPGFLDPDFEALIDLVWVGPNEFDIRVRRLKISFVNLGALTKTLLGIVKERFDKLLAGACTFQYVGSQEDGSRAVRVTVDVGGLIPAFPHLKIVGVETGDKELRLMAGSPG